MPFSHGSSGELGRKTHAKTAFKIREDLRHRTYGVVRKFTLIRPNPPAEQEVRHPQDLRQPAPVNRDFRDHESDLGGADRFLLPFLFPVKRCLRNLSFAPESEGLQRRRKKGVSLVGFSTNRGIHLTFLDIATNAFKFLYKSGYFLQDALFHR